MLPAVSTLGALRVGGDLFESLMVAAGDTAEHARAMFDESVTFVVLVAGVVAAAVAIVLAIVFARRLARPIERLAVAAAHAGVNSNLLAPGGLVDPLSNNAVVNGIPVSVSPAITRSS